MWLSLNQAHTMDGHDPDLDAFESNLQAIMVKMLHWYPIFAWPMQILRWLKNQVTTTLFGNPNAAHHFISSLIRIMHRMILNIHGMEVQTSKGIFTLGQPNGQQEQVNLLQGSPYSNSRAILTNCSCPCQPCGKFYYSAAKPDSVDFHLMKFTEMKCKRILILRT